MLVTQTFMRYGLYYYVCKIWMIVDERPLGELIIV